MLKPDFSYFDLLRNIYPNIIQERKKIRDLTFQVTEDCNLKCSYCYQINKSHHKMDFEIAKKFIDYIFENKDDPNFFYAESKTQGFVIEFIGGEPFLEIDLIEKIVDYFEYKFLQYPESSWLLCHTYNFSTNGTLYNTPKVQSFINKYRPLLHIGVTVDGDKELHDSCRLFPNGSGSYNLAIEASLSELAYGYENTKITISPDNVQYIFNGVTNLISLGFKYIHINCCFENVWNKKNSLILFKEMIRLSDWIIENNLYDKIYIAMLYPNIYQSSTQEELNSNWCGVGPGGMSVIDCQGKIYPCLRFTPSSLGPDIKPIIIGDTENGILNMEEHILNNDKLKKCTRQSLSSKECLNCPISLGCAWCLGYCYYETKDFKEKTNHICYPYKLSALASKYLCKKSNDIQSYEKIKINYSLYKDLLTEHEYNKYI